MRFITKIALAIVFQLALRTYFHFEIGTLSGFLAGTGFTILFLILGEYAFAPKIVLNISPKDLENAIKIRIDKDKK